MMFVCLRRRAGISCAILAVVAGCSARRLARCGTSTASVRQRSNAARYGGQNCATYFGSVP